MMHFQLHIWYNSILLGKPQLHLRETWFPFYGNEMSFIYPNFREYPNIWELYLNKNDY